MIWIRGFGRTRIGFSLWLSDILAAHLLHLHAEASRARRTSTKRNAVSRFAARALLLMSLVSQLISLWLLALSLRLSGGLVPSGMPTASPDPGQTEIPFTSPSPEGAYDWSNARN